MITFPNSFTNGGGEPGSGIGRLYHDRNDEQKYLEVSQAEDYVTITLYHESREQRYGYDSFRKILRFDLPIHDVILFEEVIDAEQRRSEAIMALDGDELGIYFDDRNECVSFCGMLNGRTFMIDLAFADAHNLSYLLQAMREDYDRHIDNQRFYTATYGDWKHAANNPTVPGWVRDLIERGIADHLRSSDDMEITLTFDGDYEHDRAVEALGVERSYSAGDWHAIFAEADPEVVTRIKAELGWVDPADGDLPYGLSPSTILTATIPVADNDEVVRAGYVAWLSAKA